MQKHNSYPTTMFNGTTIVVHPTHIVVSHDSKYGHKLKDNFDHLYGKGSFDRIHQKRIKGSERGNYDSDFYRFHVRNQ